MEELRATHPDYLGPTWSTCYRQSSPWVAYLSTGLCEGQRWLLNWTDTV